MTLDAMEFIRRFLQHVLPKGFMKIRHYGFLNPNSALSIEKVRELISFIHDIISLLIEIPEPETPGIKCSHCGHDLRFMTTSFSVVVISSNGKLFCITPSLL